MPSGGIKLFALACVVVCAVLLLGGGAETTKTTTTIVQEGGSRAGTACTPTPGTYCPSGQGPPQPCPVGFYCPGKIDRSRENK
jgi:hypothetical protein